MAKKRNLSAAVIFDTAAKLTEAEGLNGLTIGRLAKELNVKPASLYNHIDGFEDVRRHLAGLAIRELNDAFLQAAAGRSRDDAVLEVALAYRQFAHEHPELYKAFIRSASMKTTEHEVGYALSMQTLKKVLRAYDKQTGELAAEIALPGFTLGPPMTYEAGGRQFIVCGMGIRSDPHKLVALALP